MWEANGVRRSAGRDDVDRGAVFEGEARGILDIRQATAHEVVSQL